MDLRELALSGTKPNRHPWELARADAVAHLARRASRRHGPFDRVLDVGCGDAFLVSSLVETLGLQAAYGVDAALTPPVVERLRPIAGPKVGLFADLPALEGESLPPASLVLLLDVLEHCENDFSELRRIVTSPAVAPGAVFLLTVPAFQGLYSEHDRFLGHHRRYRLGKITNLAQDAGLRPFARSYFFCSLLLPRTLRAGLEWVGVKGAPRTGLAAYRGGPWVTTALRRTLFADFRVCDGLAKGGIHLPGLSCYVLAEKPD